MKKSIAIWYKPSPINIEENINDVEIHFNLWKLPNKTKKPLRFLDIGIKLENTKNVEELKLYFPCEIKNSGFTDIVGKFISKPDLVSAIFNENYTVSSTSTSKITQLKKSNNELAFNIYKTSPDDIQIESKFSGSVVKIIVPKQEESMYFRFRVEGDFIDSLSSTRLPTNAILESAFSEIEMIDFRVNEARDLDQSLLEIINSERKLTIRKQHFFFICSDEEEIIGSHQPFLSCRNLENYRWKDYVGLDKITENQIFLAYHWKDKDIDSSNILIKTKYEKNNWLTIIKFSIFAFVISVIVELFSNWLYDLLTNK